MNLSVRRRIGLAMGIVVLVNVAAGAASWYLDTRALHEQDRADAAVRRATWLSTVSNDVTAFVSEATDLAFGVTGGRSEEGSAEYGDLVGTDASVRRLMAQAPVDLPAADAAALAAKWEDLRVAVFVWINAEAETGHSNTRLMLTDTGTLRASVQSNISTPSALIGMDTGSLRREVRRQTEAFRLGVLRTQVDGALAEADTARRREDESRRWASTITLVAIAASLVVAVGAAVWLYRTIAAPLSKAKKVAEAVSSGDYAASFDRHGTDEVGALIHAVEEMRDSVVRRIEVMREMAGAVIVTAEAAAEAARTARERAYGQGDTGQALDAVVSRAETLSDLATQMLDA